MAKVLGFKLSKEDYLSIANDALSNNQVEKGISCLKKALSLDAQCCDAAISLANVYASLGAWELSNRTLFDALAAHPNGVDRDDIKYQLAMNFLDLKQVDVAEYYLRDIADAYGIQLPENFGEQEFQQGGGFHVVYPHGEDYYEMLIEKAYELIRQRRFDDAISLMDEVDARSKSKGAANHIVLVCLMMKNDIDSVIENAKKMLEQDKDNLAVKCALATAFLMEEKSAEAYMVLDEILQKDYTSMEDILMILPILVNMEVHAQVVKYTRRVLETLDLQPNTMIWLSQALYNLGQRDEARKVMVKVRTIFGDCSPADYYLDLYKQNPEKVNYSMDLPYVEKILRYKKLDVFLKMSPQGVQQIVDGDDEESQQMRSLIDWAFYDDNEKLKILIVDKLALVNSDWADCLLRRKLVSVDLSFDLMLRMILCLIKDNCFRLSFDVVAQDRFKSIHTYLPDAFFKMPAILHAAVSYCIADIVYTDEEPNTYLARLVRLVDGIVGMDENGKAKFFNPKHKRISTLRSMRTLIGVFLCKVYEDDDPSMKDITIRRYELNERTFNKYYDIIFGEDE